MVNAEAQVLASPATAEEIQAGIQDFEIFGDINTLDALAGGDILKWDEVKALPYAEVYVKMLKNKVQRKFERAYADIMRRKK